MAGKVLCTYVTTTLLQTAQRGWGIRAEVPVGIEDQLQKGKRQRNEEVKAGFFPRAVQSLWPSYPAHSLYAAFFLGLRLFLQE